MQEGIRFRELWTILHQQRQLSKAFVQPLMAVLVLKVRVVSAVIYAKSNVCVRKLCTGSCVWTATRHTLVRQGGTDGLVPKYKEAEEQPPTVIYTDRERVERIC